MDPERLADLLRERMQELGISIPLLAKNAGVSYETARRATMGIAGISLASSTKLLVSVGLELQAVEVAQAKGEINV